MRLTYDHHEFYRTAGIILEPWRLLELGLDNHDVAAAIWPDEVEEALAVCAENPKFHIISCLRNGIYLNRYDERGFIFHLGDGDNDPHYMLSTKYLFDLIEVPAHLRPGGEDF